VSDPLFEAVSEVAELAGAEALKHFRGRLEVEAKADGSPVTRADRDAERVVRDWVERHFPEDGILGEEFGETRPGARRRWLVDPVDGTRAFVKGVPLWGTLVAVAEGERVLAGCWWNGTRCEVSSVASLTEATVLATDVGFLRSPERGERWRALATRTANARTWGDCYGYLLVAIGRAELMADGQLSPWDAAALQVAVEEAGGVFTDWSGHATAFSDGAVATNAALATELRRALGIP
jgi:histidinol-phosphatase